VGGELVTTIRTAVPADLPAIREVYRSASLSNAGEREVLLAHPEVLVFDGAAVDEGRVRVAVAGDGAVVGFASALVTGDVVELEDLFVDPGWMRQGIATRLVEDAVARVPGAGPVEVTANEHAMAFYTSVGFVQVGVAQTRFGPARRLRRG
jgi:GNAT superfamily N-acetyltransferase